MTIAFVLRPPTAQELQRLRLAISSFCDGSGQLMQDDGRTLPGWRDFERAVAAILDGTAPETKGIFDVVVQSESAIDYGISVKSKNLDRPIEELATAGRVYMELSNSPAKFWAALSEKNLAESDFRAQREANRIGRTILEVVRGWHHEAANNHANDSPGRILDLDKSIFLAISYNKEGKGKPCRYQIHSFDLDFPEGIIWRYRSAKCLMGSDPRWPNETLFDWYGLSGGQLKYYPRAVTCRHASPVFALAQITGRIDTIEEKSARYWPNEWMAAGGSIAMSTRQCADALEAQALLLGDSRAREIISRAARELRALG